MFTKQDTLIRIFVHPSSMDDFIRCLGVDSESSFPLPFKTIGCVLPVGTPVYGDKVLEPGIVYALFDSGKVLRYDAQTGKLIDERKSL